VKPAGPFGRDEPVDEAQPAHGQSPIEARRALLSKSVLAVLTLLALGTIAERLPFPQARAFSSSPRQSSPTSAGAEAPPEAPKAGEAQLTEASLGAGLATPQSLSGSRPKAGFGGQDAPLDWSKIETEPPPVPIVDASGRALDGFFAALERTQRRLPGAVTRIAHFGDSVIVSDYVSGTLRRKLQATFGDAGHGYLLLASAWPAYFHNDVFRFSSSGFRASRIVGPTIKDGLYGLGGVTFKASPGLITQFGTVDEGDFGRNVSRFIVSYLAEPGAGTIVVKVDEQAPLAIETNESHRAVRRHEIRVPDGPHRFELSFRGATTRAFGVVLEREVPGVVLDALGVQGARIRFLDQQDDAHYRDELMWRAPSLIAYQFGANESGDGYAYPMDEYQKTMQAVIAQGQAALPEASCLVIGAMDRARVENGQVTSMKIIQLIVAEQRRAAAALGCAYFDTYEAMGGWGSMPAWVRRGLGQADMTHPSGVGAIRIGNWLYQALMDRYAEYLKRRAAAPD
jgi:lysophospholipase L1-like esterase